MSYDERVRDLLGRLVSMSPEPPPYPEEMPMARHQSEKSPRPVLVLLGAVAVVAALAIPVVLLTGGEEPVAVPATSTTVAPETSTSQAVTTTTVPDGTSSTQPVTATWSRPIYLLQTPEDSFGGNPALVPVWLEVMYPEGTLGPDPSFTEILSDIPELIPPDFFNAIPTDVQIQSVGMESVEGEEVWVADMNEAFLDGAGGLLADVTMLNQLVYTITQDTVSESVLFTVGGQPVTEYGSEGIVLTDPVGRDDYLDDLAVIFLTQPLIEGSGGYVVQGRANTFEAALTIRVLDGSGNTVDERAVQASCGTGCWGEFEEAIPADVITPGQSSVQLFTYSANDGSMTDVITIPIPEGDVWQLKHATDSP